MKIEGAKFLRRVRPELEEFQQPGRKPDSVLTLRTGRTLSDLVNQAYAPTPAEIALMWQTAPPRMPIPPP